MSRQIIKTAKGPFEIKPSATSQWICMCGLSKTPPFCDKSHLRTLDEKDDVLYQYDEKGNREEVCGCDGKECSCCHG